jgi:hypothetical protein
VQASTWWPTLAMNAVQTWNVTRLYGRPERLLPYESHHLTGLGEHLVRLALDVPDQEYRSGMQASNRWAKEMRLAGWFEWQQSAGEH